MSSTPRRARLRVAVATSTALTVAATTVLAVGGAASAAPVTAPATADDRPAAAGAAWLAGRLQDGLLLGEGFQPGTTRPLYGQSIDAALALDAVGGHQAPVAAITDAVAAAVDSYTTGADFGSPDDVYAGAVAKAAVLAVTTERDLEDFGGVDLRERLESRVLRDGPVSGRIQDESAWGDYANTLGQAFAARALAGVGSELAAPALEYLLTQQCPDGHFRLQFPAPEVEEQGCTASAARDTGPDTTATVVLQLQGLAGTNPVVDAALDEAEQWLAGRQSADGAFTAGTDTEGDNANSTGLAGWALGVRGRTVAASRAAAWVRARQAQPAGRCRTALDGETGAIAFDDRALVTGRSDGLEQAFQQWNITASQALPALLWAPKGATVRLAAKDWGRAGTNHRVAVRGLAPGETVCVRSKVSRSLETAGVRGGLRSSVRLPKGAGVRTLEVKDSTQAHRTTVKAVVPKELDVRVAQRPLKAGAVQRIVVRGLAAGEPAQVVVRGRRVARGEAGSRGRFVVRVRLPKSGPARVRATGVLPKVRVGRAAFRVVR